MKEKRSPKEIIESVENPHLEESWIKLPRKELQANSLYRSEVAVAPNKMRNWFNQFKGKRFTGVHTHPYKNYVNPLFGAYPSSEDLLNLLVNSNKKAEVIARIMSNTGQLDGYGIMRKTKKTSPPSRFFRNPILTFLSERSALTPEGREMINEYKRAASKGWLDEHESLKNFAKKYNLQYRFVPVSSGAKIELAMKDSNLENFVTTPAAIISGAAFLFSLIFISGNFTGYVIANLTPTSSNWIGGILFLIGLIGAFIYFRKRKL